MSSVFSSLASDGIWDNLTNERACYAVQDALEKSWNVAEAARKLVKAAVKAGCEDDASVSIIAWKHAPSKRRSTG